MGPHSRREDAGGTGRSLVYRSFRLGKSPISKSVHAELERRGRKVGHLDGDSVRHILPSTGFTRPELDEHIRRLGFLASKLEKNGVFVIASFVSPYAEASALCADCARTEGSRRCGATGTCK